MGLSLSEIEEKAQEFAGHLIGTPSRASADLYRSKLKGLRDLALIMQVADNRATWNAQVGMRERELVAMEQTAANVTEALAKQAPTQPERRCEIQREAIVLGEKPDRTIQLQCLLADGHPGLHTDREGVRWDEEVRFVQPAPTGPQCPSTLRISQDEQYTCRFAAGHGGDHLSEGDDVMRWTGPGNGKQEAEPTKPAVDRLHELVSMWNGFSRDQDLAARNVVVTDAETAESRGYLDGQAVAWGKAASMLQDILTEGGI